MTELELNFIRSQFKEAIQAFGPTSHGVLWNDEQQQFRRFEILFDLLNPTQPFSLNDFGCGYGALLQFLYKHNLPFTQYYGYDMTQEMLDMASSLFFDKNLHFINATFPTHHADYTVISGTFNLCDILERKVWIEYIFERLLLAFAKSNIGLAFNGLSPNKHPHVDGIFYIDKQEMIDLCRYGLGISTIKSYDDTILNEWAIVLLK